MYMTMKRLAAAAALAVLVLATATAVQADDAAASDTEPAPMEWVALPTDETAMRDLDTEHRRIVRLARRQCAVGTSFAVVRGRRNPCVITNVDRTVASSENAELAAYHAALPERVRYDAERPTTIWQTVLKRNQAAKPE